MVLARTISSGATVSRDGAPPPPWISSSSSSRLRRPISLKFCRTVVSGGALEEPAVGVDQVAGARLATRHLLDLGHRTVHHVTGPADSQESRDRIRGWRAELTVAGAPVPEGVHGDWTPSSGHEAGRGLAARRRAGEDITAVFVANDQMALGVLRSLHELGRGVPGEISVVGFDDIPEAAYFSPPLTTVRQNFNEMGRRSLLRLLEEIARGERAATRETVEPELIVRSSTTSAGGG